MQLFYGSYGAIEQSFLDFVQKNRTNPLEKWLIVCASSLVASRLKKQLAHRLGALANMHFTTMGGLLYQLDEEAGPTLPLFPENHLRSFLVQELLSKPPLNRYPVSAGFVEAVKNSLRDLGDALVDPDVWEEHVRTLPDDVLMREGDRLFWLISLYRAYGKAENNVKGYRSYQNAFERALAQVEKSSYLQGFKQIIFYGFYDMAGRQLELVKEIRLFYPISVFAPYQKLPSYRFAEKFFQTNWLSSPNAVALQSTPHALGKSGDFLFVPAQSMPCRAVRLVSAPDSAGEVFYVAKEILRLTQQEGYAWEDIGVIARNTAAYQGEIRRSFATNKIPLDASFSYPLSHYALGVFCLDLFLLVSRNFEREAVLKIVTSPYFNHPKKQAWTALVRNSLVNRDLAQWKDLLPQMKNYDPDLLVWLEKIEDMWKFLAAPHPWEKGVFAAQEFLKENVDSSAFKQKDAEIFQAINHALETICLYTAIRAESQQGQLPREIERALQELCFHEAETIENGVVFTDALRARGLTFKIVFILGLNDQTFPLVTPEDPILRDYYRYMLRDVLGYWINQSLNRADEEKLLFYAAVTSAQERVYVSFSRYGTDGKEKVISLFLTELARACCLSLEKDIVYVSGNIKHQLNEVPLVFLTAKEISYLCSLFPQSALENYEKSGLLTEEIKDSIEAALQLERSDELGQFDGIIQSGFSLFERENKKGFSPSALQELALCPLKYFFERGLHLREEDEPLSRHELSADRKGTLFHQILCDYYKNLAQNNQINNLFDSDLREQVKKSALRCMPAQGGKIFGIYPLVWNLIWQDLLDALQDFVVKDAKELGGFLPTRFEEAVSTESTPQLPCRLYGVIDRVDIDEKSKQFFIVDYKSSKKGTADLGNDLFHYLIFQPFLYGWMMQHHPSLKEYTFAGSALLSLKPAYKKRVLEAAKFAEISQRAFGFFSFLLKLIQEGIFFICPSEDCRFCPYGFICRKNSYKSLLRVNRNKYSQRLAEERH